MAELLEILAERPLLGDLLWQTTAWLAAALLASRALGRHPARAHAALLLGLAGALATPLLSAFFRARGWGLLAPIDLSLAGAGGPPPSLPLEPDAHGGAGPWLAAAAAVWAAGSALLLARLVASLRRGRRLIAGIRPIDDDAALEAAAAAARRLGLTAAPGLFACPGARGPMIWCWGRSPRILLPETMTGAGSAGLPGVLCHELAHWRRRDHLWSLAGELATVLLPWHPLLWPARRRLALLSEQACDAWALAAGESPTAFAEVLLSLVPQPRGGLALAAVSRRGSLARRIERILQAPPADPRAGRSWAALAALGAAALVTTAALAHRQADRPAGAGPGEIEPVPGAGEIVAGADTPSAPAVRVTPLELDLGRAAAGATASGTAWIVNTGPAPATIRAVRTSCGCTAVSGLAPSVLAPGTSVEFRISMVASKTPGERKTKHVTIDVEGQPALRIPVHLTSTEPDIGPAG